MKLALWVVRRNRPFAIVEDPELLDIFSDLNSQCVTPGRRTVSQDVNEIFTLSQKKVAEILQVRLTFRLISRGFTNQKIRPGVGFFFPTLLAGLTLLCNQAHIYIWKYDIIDACTSLLSPPQMPHK